MLGQLSAALVIARSDRDYEHQQHFLEHEYELKEMVLALSESEKE